MSKTQPAPKSYYHLVGKTFEYRNRKDRICTGVLRELSADKYTGKTMGVFERQDFYLRHPKLDRVPMDSILNLDEMAAVKKAMAKTRISTKVNNINLSGSTPNVFQYGGITFHKTNHLQFKIDDEVVWIQPEDKRDFDKPLVGKIKMTGHSAGNYVSVVQFDEPTHDLPRYVQVHPKNRNIVSLDELIHLEKWLESLSPEFSGDSARPKKPLELVTEPNIKVEENSLKNLTWASESNGDGDLIGFLTPTSPKLFNFDKSAVASSTGSPSTLSPTYSEILRGIATSPKVAIPKGAVKVLPTPDKDGANLNTEFGLKTSAASTSTTMNKNGERPLQQTNPFLSVTDDIKSSPELSKPSNNIGDLWTQMISSLPTPILPSQTQIQTPLSLNVTEPLSNGDLVNSSPVSIPFPSTGSLNFSSFTAKVAESPKSPFGIQSYGNSDFIDASVFALLAFNNVLHKITSIEEAQPGKSSTAANVRTILQDLIISPWKVNYLVPSANMKMLHDAIEGASTLRFPNSKMDAGQFLISFFKAMECPQFLKYDLGGGDHIHQIMLPMTWDDYRKVPYLPLSLLIRDSFHASLVRLDKIPEDLFIVKLPTSEGVLIPCDGVIPNLCVDLKEILNDNGASQGSGSNTKIYLKSVILHRNGRFVSIARASLQEGSPWVFMDSKATPSHPQVAIINNIDMAISLAENNLSSGTDVKECVLPNGFDLFKNAYICIYTRND